VFVTTGALPTGVSAFDTAKASSSGTGIVSKPEYYVKTVVDANTFQISLTPTGAAINTSGSQSGNHFARASYSAAQLDNASGGTQLAAQGAA
jgi:hypothetical protein